MRWSFKCIDVEMYRKSGMETLLSHLSITGRDERGHMACSLHVLMALYDWTREVMV